MLMPYEDRDVVQSTIRVTNAGDGLSEALAVDPAEYHLGQKVHVVLETEVVKVTYDEIGDTDVLRRVHTLRAGIGTIVDEKVVAKVLREHRVALERAKGVTRLPGVDGDGDQ
jgi:hypothetical protein